MPEETNAQLDTDESVPPAEPKAAPVRSLTQSAPSGTALAWSALMFTTDSLFSTSHQASLMALVTAVTCAVAPVEPVTRTWTPSDGVTAVDACTVAMAPEANLRVATAESSTSMWSPCTKVAMCPCTSTTSPMNHWSRSM